MSRVSKAPLAYLQLRPIILGITTTIKTRRQAGYLDDPEPVGELRTVANRLCVDLVSRAALQRPQFLRKRLNCIWSGIIAIQQAVKRNRIYHTLPPFFG